MNRGKKNNVDDEKNGSSSRHTKKSQEKAPKRSGFHHDDDDDVDSRGNIRGLIDYDSESDDSSLSSPNNGNGKRRSTPQRKSAAVAQKRIAKRLEKEEKEKSKRRRRGRGPSTPSSSDSSFKVEDVEDSSVDDSDESEESEEVGTRRRGFAPRRRLKKPAAAAREETSDEETEEESEDESSDYNESDDYDEEQEDEEDDDDEDDDEDDEDDDDEKTSRKGTPFGLQISFGGADDDFAERMIPRRHNMKKESKEVKQFVKLISKPVEENTIDDQIDQFKSLEASKQKALLESLEKREEYTKKEQPLMFRLLGMKLGPEMMATVMSRYNALQNMDPSTGEYYKLRSWMEKLVSMPLGQYKEMPVKLEDGPEPCGKFMEYARQCMEEAIYGQNEAKLQILQFIACKLSNPSSSGLSLLLIGPPGIGKTSLIKNGIAKAVGWPFQFISLGGDSDATSYVGHQFVYEGSHCGKIANCLAASKSMSTVLMFDELDKISTTAKGEEVQNLLVHLTDPVQNMMFEDKYLTGVPLDLSRVMFVFSGNDINKIDKILLDRMVVVKLEGYGLKEKLAIAEQYIMPAALKEVALTERVGISREVLQHVLENYTGEEQGVRELKRCCEQIVQKINMLRMFNAKDLPFHIPGFSLPFVVKKEHVDLFLKKKDPPMDVSVQRMYI